VGAGQAAIGRLTRRREPAIATRPYQPVAFTAKPTWMLAQQKSERLTNDETSRDMHRVRRAQPRCTSIATGVNEEVGVNFGTARRLIRRFANTKLRSRQRAER